MGKAYTLPFAEQNRDKISCPIIYLLYYYPKEMYGAEQAIIWD
jgi:hypothetical protein